MERLTAALPAALGAGVIWEGRRDETRRTGLQFGVSQDAQGIGGEAGEFVLLDMANE